MRYLFLAQYHFHNLTAMQLRVQQHWMLYFYRLTRSHSLLLLFQIPGFRPTDQTHCYPDLLSVISGNRTAHHPWIQLPQ